MKNKQVVNTHKFKKLLLKFRKHLFTGIITALPIYITYIFFAWLMKFFHKKLYFIPQKVFPENVLKENVILTISFEVILFIFIIVCLFLIGVLTSHYFGKKMIKIGDKFLNRIPLIRNIYMGSKQILSSFTVGNKKTLRKVVMLEYPRKGIKSLGFLTGEIKITKRGKKDKTLYPIFLPSTPNPTTGYFLLLAKKDIQILDISVEEAARLIISGGIIGKQIKIHDKQ